MHGDSHGTATHAHVHKELGFVRKYIFSMDHKVIGIQFLISSILMSFIGGGLAMLIRLQLAWPSVPQPVVAKLIKGGFENNIMKQEFYNMAFTMHGTIMIFFVIMPLLIGAFGNFLIPLQIGARDMAFPFVNMLSYWLFPPAAIIMVASFWFGAAGAGWTGYAPLSVTPRAMPEASIGQSMWLASLLLVGTSSILGSLNYITTIINLRAPGMTLFRMPLSIWGLFITAILLLLATPVLASALAMALFDRLAGTSFFVPGGLVVNWHHLDKDHPHGGQALLWQHLFWFFGHPEVYIMMLPAMGFASEVLSTFSRKPVFGYKAMVLSICAIAGLGFIVWGHHMFQSGMNPTLGTAFMTATMVIAVPSAVKTFNWLGTLWGGNIRFTSAMLNGLAFVAMFIIGGLTGVFLASMPVDIFLHDGYFVVGHLHYVLFGGSLFGGFAAIYYWYPKMFGRMMSETLGRLHTLLTFIFYNGFAFPMFILGAQGMQRRIYSWTEYVHLQDVGPINRMMTISAFLLGASQIIFVLNLLWSSKMGKKADRNPWQANTLEWTTPSPPPHENFDRIPVVHHGPYEYSIPGLSQDFMPQNVAREAIAGTSGNGRDGSDGRDGGDGRH